MLRLMDAALLADAVLALHALVVAFVVLGLLAVLAGGPLGWAWVRIRWWRLAHLAAIALIAVQAWLGRLCPLTVWENALRREAGQAGYELGFLAAWLRRLLYFDAPAWVFTLGYSLFALLVLAAWRAVPPRPRGARLSFFQSPGR